MNREIKFRAWYVDEFHYGIEKHHIEYDSTSNPCGEVWDFSDWLTYTKVQQYTGLKDKNGKEIYEGDIIIFDKQDGVWSDQVNRIIEVKYPFICGNAHLAKIIGNIFETPELLEKNY